MVYGPQSRHTFRELRDAGLHLRGLIVLGLGFDREFFTVGTEFVKARGENFGLRQTRLALRFKVTDHFK